MKKTILIASAAIVALAVPAIAAHHERGDGPHKMMMKDMTKADVEAKINERFAAVDANKDGAITMEEVKAAREAKRAARMDSHFKTMDADGDGAVSRGEFDAAHAARHEKMKMARADSDREGHRKMYRGGHHGMRMKMGGMMFERADANKDGKVTLAEAKTAAMTHFDKVDADKNGTVTSQERMDYWKARKAEWKENAAKAS